MLMICSSRARNRSPDPVVSCFFGRIAPSNAATESRLADSRKSSKQNCKLSGAQILKPCNRKTIGNAKSDSWSRVYKLFTANKLNPARSGDATAAARATAGKPSPQLVFA
jgi:hypothetical protein